MTTVTGTVAADINRSGPHDCNRAGRKRNL
jgi:hypothetical protein